MKYQIHQVQPLETMFFDWLGTDMDTVNVIMRCDNLDAIFTYDNIVHVPKPSFDRLIIVVKSLPYCVAIHDFTEFNDRQIENFLCKYKRRHARLMEMVKTPKKPLCFIRYGNDMKDEQQEAFVQTILHWNRNCPFILVCIRIDQPEYSVVYQPDRHFLQINLTLKPDESDWRTSCLPWPDIFKTIRETAMMESSFKK